MFRAALVFCSLFMISSPVLAENPTLYYGVTLGSSNYDELGYSADMATLTGRLGYDLPSRDFVFGAEVRLAHGHKGSFNDVDIQVNWLASALAKFSWQALDRVFLTLYGGYTMADTKATTVIGSSTITDDSPSYGVSIDLFANRKHGVNFEWIRYLDSTMRGADYTVDYVGLGYFSRF